MSTANKHYRYYVNLTQMKSAVKPAQYRRRSLWRIFWADKSDVQKSALGMAIVLFLIAAYFVFGFGLGL